MKAPSVNYRLSLLVLQQASQTYTCSEEIDRLVKRDRQNFSDDFEFGHDDEGVLPTNGGHNPMYVVSLLLAELGIQDLVLAFVSPRGMSVILVLKLQEFMYLGVDGQPVPEVEGPTAVSDGGVVGTIPGIQRDDSAMVAFGVDHDLWCRFKSPVDRSPRYPDVLLTFCNNKYIVIVLTTTKWTPLQSWLRGIRSILKSCQLGLYKLLSQPSTC